MLTKQYVCFNRLFPEETDCDVILLLREFMLLCIFSLLVESL